MTERKRTHLYLVEQEIPIPAGAEVSISEIKEYVESHIAQAPKSKKPFDASTSIKNIIHQHEIADGKMLIKAQIRSYVPLNRKNPVKFDELLGIQPQVDIPAKTEDVKVEKQQTPKPESTPTPKPESDPLVEYYRDYGSEDGLSLPSIKEEPRTKKLPVLPQQAKIQDNTPSVDTSSDTDDDSDVDEVDDAKVTQLRQMLEKTRRQNERLSNEVKRTQAKKESEEQPKSWFTSKWLPYLGVAGLVAGLVMFTGSGDAVDIPQTDIPANTSE